VFFTTYKPTGDPCQFGGKSFMWAMKYNTGGFPSCSALGKALVQVSTGSFNELELEDLITCRNKDGSIHVPPIQNPDPRDHPPPTPSNPPGGGNLPPPVTPAMTGKPPSDPPPIVSRGGNAPVKKILHIQEH